MENGRKLLRGIALAAIAVIGLGGIALFASPSLAADSRPDVIRIDAIGQLKKKLEMPPAVFLHDEHTKALAAAGKDCSVCHTAAATGHTVKFQREGDGTDPKKLEKLYHNGCIGCHENMASDNLKTGPLDGECRACHNTKLPFKSVQAPVKMGSKSLHYLHVSSEAIVNPAESAGKLRRLPPRLRRQAQEACVGRRGRRTLALPVTATRPKVPSLHFRPPCTPSACGVTRTWPRRRAPTTPRRPRRRRRRLPRATRR